MANIKATSSNIDQILTDMAADYGTSRTDQFYFVSNELNENTIRQAAWDRSMIVTVTSINEYNSKFVFVEILS